MKPHVKQTENLLIQMNNELRINQFHADEPRITKEIIQHYAILLTPQPGEVKVPLSVYDDVLKSKPFESLNPTYFERKNNSWIIQWKPQNAIKALLKNILSYKATKPTLTIVGAIILAVAAMQIVF